MRYVVLLLMLGIFVALSAQEQPASTTSDTVAVPDVAVTLAQKISSKDARVGDAFELRFAERFDVSSPEGKKILGWGNKLYAHITTVSRRDKQHPEARLGFVVDGAKVRGKLMKFDAVFCGAQHFGEQFGTAGVPDDTTVELWPDKSVGSVLVSSKGNITLSDKNYFLLCQPYAVKAAPAEASSNASKTAPTIIPFLAPAPIRVESVRILSSKTARPGEVVEMRYDGRYTANMYGHVSDAAALDGSHSEARLGLVVDRVETKVKEIKLNAVFCGGTHGFAISCGTNLAWERIWTDPVCVMEERTKKRIPDDVEFRTSPILGVTLVSKRSDFSLGGYSHPFFVCPRLDQPRDRVAISPDSVTAGVTFLVMLMQDVDAGTAKSGDPVSMLITSYTRQPPDALVIPRWAMLSGKITVAESASADRPSRIGIVMERATWAGGVVPLNAFVVPRDIDLTLPQTGSLPHGLTVYAVNGDSCNGGRGVKVEKFNEGTVLTHPKEDIKLGAGCMLYVQQM